jgi:hypothetical protein
MASLVDEDGHLWEGQDARASRLNFGVEGVHAVLPFQCELCWFRNLEGKDPVMSVHNLYLKCIRRANLDAMNAKARTTVAHHLGFVRDAVKNASSIGRTPFFPVRGPFPVEDTVGMGLAVDLLLKSIRAKGRIGKYIQFDTMRKGRSTFTMAWHSSPTGVLESKTFANSNLRVRSTSCPSQSDWFRDFLVGAQDRMGYDTMKQLDVPIQAVIRQLELIWADAEFEPVQSHRHLLIKTGALIAILTAASLRGHEGFYLDISGTMKYLNRGSDGVLPSGKLTKRLFTEEEARRLPQICICLLGKFKGETGERYHSIILANESSSGLKTRWWVEKLMEVCTIENRSTGYAFNEADGSAPSSSEYNALVRHYLALVAEEEDSVFEGELDLTRYGISRTYRKTSETRARRAGIPKDQVEVVNRWKTIERAKGRRPNLAMADHYANARELGTLTWRYSYAL